MKTLLTNTDKSKDLSKIENIKGVSIAAAFSSDYKRALPELKAIYCHIRDRAKILNILSPNVFPITTPNDNEHHLAIWIKRLK